MSSDRSIPTPYGDARLACSRASRPTATLLLGHGAGQGIDNPELATLARVLPRHGINVFRLEQPWVAQGKRIAPRAEVLDEVLAQAMNRIRVRTPIVIGGRSAGARSAVRQARRLGGVGVVALAYPLHPPGKPERSRVEELLGAGLPTLVVQGERDPYGTPAEFPPSVDLTQVPFADHAFGVPKRAPFTEEEGLAVVLEAVLEWVTARVA